MRITALVKDTEHVCCRYRIAAFRPHLLGAGHTLDIRGWPGFWLSRLQLYHHLQHADLLIVQRKLLPAWQLRMVRRRVRWLAYDYDDAVFLRNSYSERGHDSAGRTRRFDDMVRQADVVVAGNDFLRDQAMAVIEPGRVHVIPTCVDVARYPVASHDTHQRPIQLVWVGSSSTIRGLEQLTPTLEHLGKTLPDLQLKVICDRSVTLQHLPVEFCSWQEAAEPGEIAAADIGISWLPDDPWSRGKCGLKVLQYMAAGLPVVANPVGVQAQLVRHGETGFLAQTAAEWHQAIARLAGDPALRQSMGQAARQCAQATYNVPIGAAQWLNVLEQLQGQALARAG
jgi:glycosyltransferase involved in cell wall biosynthesis